MINGMYERYAVHVREVPNDAVLAGIVNLKTGRKFIREIRSEPKKARSASIHCASGNKFPAQNNPLRKL